MGYEDRTYHGVPRSETSRARILVEKPASGPTERRDVRVLQVLAPWDETRLGGFGWGYNGSGTSRAAAALLADALDLGEPGQAGISFGQGPPDATLARLREDFCTDVLSQLCDEWRLRRIVVLRWAHSWYLQHGISLPTALRDLLVNERF